MFEFLSVETGRSMMPGAGRVRDMERGGMVFAGSPNEVADRILHLHELLGHSRQIIQMDVGGMPHATFLQAIELLGDKRSEEHTSELQSLLLLSSSLFFFQNNNYLIVHN